MFYPACEGVGSIQEQFQFPLRSFDCIPGEECRYAT